MNYTKTTKALTTITVLRWLAHGKVLETENGGKWKMDDNLALYARIRSAIPGKDWVWTDMTGLSLASFLDICLKVPEERIAEMEEKLKKEGES